LDLDGDFFGLAAFSSENIEEMCAELVKHGLDIKFHCLKSIILS
jgi:predicted amidohydrolase YtcJ